MKKILSFVVYTLFYFNLHSQINCNYIYFVHDMYADILYYDPAANVVGTSGISIYPATPALGLAVSEHLNGGTGKTFYTISATGTYMFWNGSTWINTGHSTGGTAAVNIGGSGPYIYSLIGATGQVFRYDGTGNAVLVATISGYNGPWDIIGDAQGNFYILGTAPGNQFVDVYNPSGTLICRYTVSGLPGWDVGGGGYAVINGVLYADLIDVNGYPEFYRGTFSGTHVSFTYDPGFSGFLFDHWYYDGTMVLDYGSCAFPAFNTTITSSTSSINLCIGQTASLTASSNLMSPTYIWSGPGIVSGQGTNNVIVNQPGTYTLVTTSSAMGCANSITTTYVVNNATPAPANAGTLSGTQTICVGSTTTFTSTHAGGTWSSDNVGVATVNASGVISGVSPGTATITYTMAGTGGCPNATTTHTVTVTAPSNAGTLSGTPTICVGGSTTFTSTHAGGTWSSDNAGVATVSTSGVISGIGSGTATITYTMAGTGGCPNATVTRTVTVTAPANAGTLSGTQAICVGSTTTFTSTHAGGTWSSDNLGVATVNASGVISGVSPGTVTITYTMAGTGGCPNATTTHTVTVTAPSNAGTLSGTPTICVGGSTTFTSTHAGGTWSSDNVGVATVSTSGVISGVGSGTATITYTVTGSGGCPNATVTRTVTVTAPANAGTLSGTQAICVGSTTTFTSTHVGGTWSSDNPGVATINSSTGVISGVSPGTATMTYTMAGTGGCSNATVTRTVTVTAAVNAGTLSGVQAICVGSTTTFTSTNTGGTWSSDNVGVATVNTSGVISGVGSGTATITYTVTGSGGCPNATVTRTVTVTAPANAGTLSGTQAICVSSTTTFTSTHVGGTWSSDNPGVATINSSTGDITAISSGTATMTYMVTGTGGCSDATVTRTITVTSAPIPGTLSGIQAICAGGTTTFISTQPGGTWASDNLGVATIDPLTGVITASGLGTATMTYTLIGTGGCSDVTTTRTVTVTSVPDPGVLSGLQTICVGSSTTFISTQTGGTWSSDDISVATIDPLTGNITGVGSGTATMTYTFGGSGGCVNVTATRTVIVTAPPISGTLSGIQSICIGGTTTFISTQPGGTWTSDNTSVATINSITGDISGLGVGVATITYTVSATGGCSVDATMTRTISVDVTPSLSVSGAISCDASTGTYSVNVFTNATTLTASSGTVIGNTISGIPLGTNLIVTATNGSGCTSSTATITGPLTCPSDCTFPNLTVGNGVCDGVGSSTYSVAFSLNPSTAITTNAGTITGNTITGIPIGTNVIVTAGSGDCAVSVAMVSPLDCNNPCANPLISVAGAVCDGSSIGTYEVNFISIPGVTVTTSSGTISGSSITGIPNQTDITLTASFSGCSDQIVQVIAPADCPECIIPSLSVSGAISCDALTGTYSVNVSTTGTNLVASVGTINGNVISGIPLGTNLVVTSSNGVGCTAATATVTGPLTCPSDCVFPNLTVGNGVCEGVGSSTYSVAFNVNSSTPVTVNAGTVSGNSVTGIPIGTNVIVTAGSGDCAVSVTMVSPSDCNNPCANPLISVAGAVCDGASIGTYEVNFISIPGVTVTTSSGIISGSSIIGIPNQTDITLTASFSGCSDQIVQVIAPADCPECITPNLSVSGAISCDALTGTYSVNVFTNATTLTASSGTVIGNTISGIPLGTNLIVIASNGAGCTSSTATVTGPVTCPSDCAFPVLSVGNGVCEGVGSSTYSVAFSLNPSTSITTNVGTITGNTITGIPIGTNVIVTAGSGDCAVSVAMVSPLDCNNPCANPFISVAETTCDGSSIGTYGVNFISIPGATVTTSSGIISGSSITGIPSQTDITLMVSFNGCSNQTVQVIAPADCPECITPSLSVSGAVSCDASTSTYSVNVFTNATTLTASSGTVIGNTISGIPLGTNLIVTASNGAGCTSSTAIVTGPLTCPSDCTFPNLTVGNGVCEGVGSSTYSVAFSLNPSTSITTNAGTITGNTITGIPIGTNVIVTAGSGDCAVSVAMVSPLDCNNPCANPFISVAGAVCDGSSIGTYEVNFISIPGVTVTTSSGTISGGRITGIPNQTDITLTASFSGCSDQIVQVIAPDDCPECKINPPTLALVSTSIEVCSGKSVSFEIKNPNVMYSYLWEDFNGNSIGTDTIYSFTSVELNKTGVYSVTAMDTIGCSTTSKIVLKVVPCEMTVTEVISPNGDGVNDFLHIENIEGYPNTKVWIHNRWGSLIFHSENYKNEWDGTSQSSLNIGGEELPEGTYFYIIQIGGEKDHLNYGEIYKGYVYLKR